MQNELEKLVKSGEIPVESYGIRTEIIQKINAYGSAAWTYGFCISSSFNQYDIVLSLMQLDELELPHIGIYSVLFKEYISKILDSHMPALSSKKSRMTYTDEYGDTNSKKWATEIRKYYKEKITKSLDAAIDEAPEKLFNDFSETRIGFMYWATIRKNHVEAATIKVIDFYISHYDSNHAQNDLPKMTGLDYEIHIADIINKETSWSASVTKSSGDQGADLILSKGPLTAVLQTKYYSSKVGNKAIQEVFSAKKFYTADLAFVVSNAEFTNSAWALAEKTGVKIISEKNLIEVLK